MAETTVIVEEQDPDETETQTEETPPWVGQLIATIRETGSESNRILANLVETQQRTITELTQQITSDKTEMITAISEIKTSLTPTPSIVTLHTVEPSQEESETVQLEAPNVEVPPVSEHPATSHKLRRL